MLGIIRFIKFIKDIRGLLALILFLVAFGLALQAYSGIGLSNILWNPPNGSTGSSSILLICIPVQRFSLNLIETMMLFDNMYIISHTYMFSKYVIILWIFFYIKISMYFSIIIKQQIYLLYEQIAHRIDDCIRSEIFAGQVFKS